MKPSDARLATSATLAEHQSYECNSPCRPHITWYINGPTAKNDWNVEFFIK
jgi:hypothetical protein